MLVELLRIDAVPSSYVPPKNIRELRDLTRHRESLVSEAIVLKNRIHAEIAWRGLRPPADLRSSFTKKHIAWLRTLDLMTINDLLGVLGSCGTR